MLCKSAAYASYGVLVFAHDTSWQYSDGNPLTGASNAGGLGTNRDSDKYLAIDRWLQWWSANNNWNHPPCSVPHRRDASVNLCLSQAAWTTTTKKREQNRTYLYACSGDSKAEVIAEDCARRIAAALGLLLKLTTDRLQMYSSTGLPCSSDPPVYSQSRSLRSSTQSFLSVPPHDIDIAARRFSVAAPRLWNSLPLSCRTTPSVNIFRTDLRLSFSVCDGDIVARAAVLWRVINWLLIDWQTRSIARPLCDSWATCEL